MYNKYSGKTQIVSDDSVESSDTETVTHWKCDCHILTQ